jgi:pimeloyl-ACP methyl ester carboxylesterase
VVVLHGGPGIGHNYVTDIAPGLENRFRFIFYDQRRAGLAYAYAKERFRWRRMSWIWRDSGKPLEIEVMNLISHSARTYLAMSYFQTYPLNVKNLVLLGAFMGHRLYF